MLKIKQFKSKKDLGVLSLLKKVSLMIVGLMFCQIAVADWQQNNRAVSLTSGLIQQDYYENDNQGRTNNGILLTEKEKIHEIALNTRYQTQKGIWLQGRVSSVTGATAYDGYLQNGSILTPYQSVTDNAMINMSANIGYAVPIGEKLQIIPNISGLNQRWDRRLTQYDERFNAQSVLAGVVAQYQVTKNLGLEVSADVGKNINSEIKVAQRNFEQDLAKQNIWQVGGKASYQLNDKLALIGEVNYRETKHGESASQNGLNYPSGKSKHTSGLAGVRVSF